MKYLIKETSQLKDLSHILQQAVEHSHPIAVDTEFVREKTYYARLCLLQIAIGEDQYCIDVLNLEVADCLKPVFTATNVLKVFHAAAQDLEVLYQTLGYLPSPVFDTQLAYAFISDNAQISYTALVQLLMNIELGKSQARTDWSKRPLSQEQLDYAADDVAHLVAMQQQLTQHLEEQKKLDWYQQEMISKFGHDGFDHYQDNAYLRFSGASLTNQQQAFLKQLAYWREGVAQVKNIPRNWLIHDDKIYTLATTHIESEQDIIKLGVLTKSHHEKYRKEIYRMFVDSQQAINAIWKKSEPLDKQQKKHCSKLMNMVREYAKKYQISPSLLATRKDIESLYRHSQSDKLLNGWRKKLFSEKLLELRDSLKA